MKLFRIYLIGVLNVVYYYFLMLRMFINITLLLIEHIHKYPYEIFRKYLFHSHPIFNKL